MLWCEKKPAKKITLLEQAFTVIKQSNKEYLPSPVKNTEKGIHDTKHQEFLIQQPVDASFPSEQELGEATKPCIGHLKAVGNRHIWF